VTQKLGPPAGDQGPNEESGKSGQPLSKQSIQSPQVQPPTLRQVFQARAEARATLWEAGEISLYQAVDELRDAADENGLAAALGDDAIQEILAGAFKAVRP
jgi:hypothetical protein